GEAGVDLADAVAVLVGCGTADVAAVGEVVVGLVELFQAQQPVFEGQVVGEAGVGVSGVALGDADLDVAVLDGGGDQSFGLAHDVPGQGAPEPGGGDGAGRVGGDGVGAGVGVAVGVD